MVAATIRFTGNATAVLRTAPAGQLPEVVTMTTNAVSSSTEGC